MFSYWIWNVFAFSGIRIIMLVLTSQVWKYDDYVLLYFLWKWSLVYVSHGYSQLLSWLDSEGQRLFFLNYTFATLYKLCHVLFYSQTAQIWLTIGWCLTWKCWVNLQFVLDKMLYLKQLSVNSWLSVVFILFLQFMTIFYQKKTYYLYENDVCKFFINKLVNLFFTICYKRI